MEAFEGLVGVGGVFRMEGAFVSAWDGGVEGRSLPERSWSLTRDRPLEDATLAAVGGLIAARSAGGSGGFVTDIRGLFCGWPPWEGGTD